MSFKITLADALHRLKGFDVATVSGSNDKILVDNEGRRYLITITEIKDKGNDIFKDMDKHLR